MSAQEGKQVVDLSYMMACLYWEVTDFGNGFLGKCALPVQLSSDKLCERLSRLFFPGSVESSIYVACRHRFVANRCRRRCFC